ncbi:hypothetical protein [Rickettsia peacockii]|uniref:hypothetical protein n=1 Tax=Rickettsia peacockii TaxID=47589 RepID=UPI001E4D4ED9|nr:hypothetical protein [Rickettsia peacockii]
MQEVQNNVILSSALLRGSKNLLDIIPWLDHGIQKKINKDWIPLQARSMTIKDYRIPASS